MLVLQRRLMEKVRIGLGEDQVIIQVIKARDGVVRLGIEAPRHIRVDREEVYQERVAEGKS